MTNDDFSHGPSSDWTEAQKSKHVALPMHAKRALTQLRTRVEPDPAGDLTFVSELIDQLEAAHKADPEANISLSVPGSWTATFETVVSLNDEYGVDQIAA